MRRGYALIALGLVLLTGVGCDPLVFQLPPEVLVPAPTAATNLQFATETVARLRTLSVGQTRDEVLQKMSAASVEGCVAWSWEDREFYLRHFGYLRCVKTAMITSPYRTASLESGGVCYEALFYYTGGTGPEGGITDQQLTPVLLGNDKLVGWGWDHPLVKQLRPGLFMTQSAAAPAPSGDRPSPQPQC